MEYFESDVPSTGDGLCSDNSCPCSEVRIPRGEGYLYIDQQLVDSRRQHPSLVSAKLAMHQARANIQATLGPTTVSYRLGPILVCEEGAKLRKLDLRVAAEDAVRWWATGQVPLRATPIKIAETRIFKGNSIEEAKALAKKEILEDSVDKIKVLKDVKVDEKVMYDLTFEKTIQKLKKLIPEEAFDIKDIVSSGQEKDGTADVEIPSGNVINQYLKYSLNHYIPDIRKDAKFIKIECIIPEKKFLGFVLKQGTYRIFWKTTVSATVTYKMPAEVEVYLKPKK